MNQLSHVDKDGRVKMVDTSDKVPTTRHAIASARVIMSAETVAAVKHHRTPKGDHLKQRASRNYGAKRTRN